MLQAAAAGHLHADDGNAFDIVFADDLAELFRIICAVQLGAAYQGDPSFDEFFVKIPVSKSGAVGGDKKVCSVKKRRFDGDKLDLYRPLPQLLAFG